MGRNTFLNDWHIAYCRISMKRFTWHIHNDFAFLALKMLKSLKNTCVLTPKSATLSWNWYVLSTCFREIFRFQPYITNTKPAKDKITISCHIHLNVKTERIAFSCLALPSHYEKVYLTQTYWFPFLSIKKCWKSLKSSWVVAPKSAIVSWNWLVFREIFRLHTKPAKNKITICVIYTWT